ncbi:MAG: YraN family protein [Candidatus Omnitrophota bacterium]
MSVGKKGEQISERFLISRGFAIKNRNFITPFGEIDLIAKKKDCTVFFEVKTRIHEEYALPLDSITKKKQKNIIKNCAYYLQRFKLINTPCRIDAIGVTLNEKMELEILRHIKDAVKVRW